MTGKILGTIAAVFFIFFLGSCWGRYRAMVIITKLKARIRKKNEEIEYWFEEFFKAAMLTGNDNSLKKTLTMVRGIKPPSKELPETTYHGPEHIETR